MRATAQCVNALKIVRAEMCFSTLPFGCCFLFLLLWVVLLFPTLSEDSAADSKGELKDVFPR